MTKQSKQVGIGFILNAWLFAATMWFFDLKLLSLTGFAVLLASAGVAAAYIYFPRRDGPDSN